jgi:hypothetical protein
LRLKNDGDSTGISFGKNLYKIHTIGSPIATATKEQNAARGFTNGKSRRTEKTTPNGRNIIKYATAQDKGATIAVNRSASLGGKKKLKTPRINPAQNARNKLYQRVTPHLILLKSREN